jgi:hypothetical protein
MTEWLRNYDITLSAGFQRIAIPEVMKRFVEGQGEKQ